MINKEEIQEAIKIIKEPITVNPIEYKYFTQENYEKLLRVYENCQQFVDFYEHFEHHLKILEDENEQLKKQKDDVVEYIKSQKYEWEDDDGAINVDCCCDGFKLLRMLGEIDD